MTSVLTLKVRVIVILKIRIIVIVLVSPFLFSVVKIESDEKKNGDAANTSQDSADTDSRLQSLSPDGSSDAMNDNSTQSPFNELHNASTPSEMCREGSGGRPMSGSCSSRDSSYGYAIDPYVPGRHYPNSYNGASAMPCDSNALSCSDSPYSRQGCEIDLASSVPYATGAARPHGFSGDGYASSFPWYQSPPPAYM